MNEPMSPSQMPFTFADGRVEGFLVDREGGKRAVEEVPSLAPQHPACSEPPPHGTTPGWVPHYRRTDGRRNPGIASVGNGRL